ncbi:hypothetical protein ABZT43_51020 [Streptomyces sp. NPDC005349]|uniref:hypothetical protein n=1 Tax=Streptomyces sp. NPDC005349 TaxID=3157037 RepID=UPI0033BD06A6
MSQQRTTAERHVGIPGICCIRKPDGAMRCTLSAGHGGEHRHFFSGELRNGVRTGTTWPRRPGEKQAD